jgi:hypothetical protein
VVISLRLAHKGYIFMAWPQSQQSYHTAKNLLLSRQHYIGKYIETSPVQAEEKKLSNIKISDW